MGISTKRKAFNFQAAIMALCVFLSLRPYFLWNIEGKFILDHLFVWYIPLIIAVIGFYQHKKEKGINFFFLSFLAILLLYCIFQNLGLKALFVICLVFVPFMKKEFVTDSLDNFRSILAGVLTISLVVWLLVILGIELPKYTIEPLNDVKIYNYSAYPMVVIPNDIDSKWRFHGPFDEPGFLGTICALTLFIEKFNLRSKKNIIIFLSGLVSFSMFFYVITAIYYIIVLTRHNRKWLFALLLIIPLFYLATKNVTILDEYVYSRFEYDSSTGTFEGDSRAGGEKNESLMLFVLGDIRSSDILYGNADLLETMGVEGAFNIFIGIIIYGIIIIALYTVFFIVYSLHMRLSFEAEFLFLLLLITTLYQRPQIFDVGFLFLFSAYIIINSQLDFNVKRAPEKLL